MATEKTVPRDRGTRLAKRKPAIEEAVVTTRLDVDKIDVTSLSLDESYDVDCDPYNRTGQHLVDALRKRRED